MYLVEGPVKTGLSYFKTANQQSTEKLVIIILKLTFSINSLKTFPAKKLLQNISGYYPGSKSNLHKIAVMFINKLDIRRKIAAIDPCKQYTLHKISVRFCSKGNVLKKIAARIFKGKNILHKIAMCVLNKDHGLHKIGKCFWGNKNVLQNFAGPFRDSQPIIFSGINNCNVKSKLSGNTRSKIGFAELKVFLRRML